MKILINISFIVLSLNVMAMSRGAAPNYLYSCEKPLTGEIQKYETDFSKVQRIDYDSDFSPPLDRYGNDVKDDPTKKSRVNYAELTLDNEIKCIYKIDYILSRPERSEKFSVHGKFFSHICLELKDSVNFLNRLDLDFNGDYGPTAIDAGDGKKKIVQNQRTKLGYLWQKGECSPDSLNYFQELKDTTQKNLLLEKKFTLLKEDKDYNLFYANPGLVIKTKNPASCKNDDRCNLKIVYKKQLKAAIYDINGKLYTDEDLEDRSDCSLEFLSRSEFSISNRFKYWMCELGINKNSNFF